MGTYLNPGNENFKIDISDDIYVDKTLLIEKLNRKLNTRNRFLCVSRPRRFGKTMTNNMIAAYYSTGCDSSNLFSNFKISQCRSFAEHLNKYNVIKIDMGGIWSRFKENAVSKISKLVKNDFRECFESIKFDDDDDIPECIIKAFKKTKTQFILIFDEYDILIRNPVGQSLLDDYLAFLNGLFKNDNIAPFIALAYLTGILPIIKEKAQSKLNNFTEYTMIESRDLSEHIGFTDSEVKDLCKNHSINYDECKAWYNGYSLGETEIYDPKSVVEAIVTKEFSGHWSNTSSYQPIYDYISMNISGLKDDVEKMISGSSVKANTDKYMNTISNLNTKDNIFAYLTHLGYLAYDKANGTCRIPNHEVRMEWANALEDSPSYASTVNLIKQSESLLKATWSCDNRTVENIIAKTHSDTTSPLSYNNEQSMQSAIFLAYIHAGNFYTIIKELPSGNGYADIAFIPYKPNIPAMIIELKMKGTAETALDQIKSKKYFAGLEKYAGNTLLVGISYDKKTKKHYCEIEKA